MMPVTALISEPSAHGFHIRRFRPEPTELSKIFDGPAEIILGRGWSAYVGENAKMQGRKVNTLSTMYLDQLSPGFARRDVLAGPVMWLGGADPVGNDLGINVQSVNEFAQLVLTTNTTSAPITVIRWKNDVHVYDDGFSEPLGRVDTILAAADLAERAEENGFGVIEVFSNITPGTWTEIRVEIMDDITIDLHDHRSDRSYG